MSEHARKEFEKWIKNVIDDYKSVLMIDLVEVEVQKGEQTEYLSISCAYPYANNVIWYSDVAFEDWKKKKLKRTFILHELCHILTDPLYVKATRRYVNESELEDERELLTDKIQIIIHNLTKKS